VKTLNLLAVNWTHCTYDELVHLPCMLLTSHSTQFRSFRRRSVTGLMTQPTVSKHWRRVVSHPDSSQSHQAHLTVLQ